MGRIKFNYSTLKYSSSTQDNRLLIQNNSTFPPDFLRIRFTSGLQKKNKKPFHNK